MHADCNGDSSASTARAGATGATGVTHAASMSLSPTSSSDDQLRQQQQQQHQQHQQHQQRPNLTESGSRTGEGDHPSLSPNGCVHEALGSATLPTSDSRYRTRATTIEQ